MRIWVEFEVFLNKLQMKTLVQNENINTWVYFKGKEKIELFSIHIKKRRR